MTDIFTIMIGWSVFPIFCAVVAVSKRRSILGWFLLGLFFGLIAGVALLCLPELYTRAPKGEGQYWEERRAFEASQKAAREQESKENSEDQKD